MMMMMMMMSGFVECVITSPQTISVSRTRAPSDVQRTSRGGEELQITGRLVKLFQMTGPATAKLLVPSVVLVLGTDSDPVPADHRCCLPAMVRDC